MFDRFTDQARTAIILSQHAARTLGHDEIDSGDLLLGVFASTDGIGAGALTQLGLSRADLRERCAALRPVVVDPTRVDGHIPFTAELKEALEAALGEAVALGHTDLSTGHLVLGVLARPDSVGLRALAASGVAGDAARTAVLEQYQLDPANGGSPEARTTAGELLDFDPRPPVPGRPALVAGLLVSLVWYAATTGLIISLRWREAKPAALLILLVLVPIGIIAATAFPGGRVRRRLVGTTTGPGELTDGVCKVLAAGGIGSVELRLSLDAQAQDSSMRAGRKGWIVLASRTVRNPAALHFVLAHEVAHLLRDDAVRRRVAAALYAALIGTSLLSFDTTAIAIAVPAALVHMVADRWWSELACDATAVRWAGRGALRAWAEDRRELLREPANRVLVERAKRVPDPLFYPPLGLRLSLGLRRG